MTKVGVFARRVREVRERGDLEDRSQNVKEVDG
jgi:hypothetical protein